MMKYLLDTNTCIRFINGRAPLIRVKMRQVDRMVEGTGIIVTEISRIYKVFSNQSSGTVNLELCGLNASSYEETVDRHYA